ncbi:MAG: tyrosine-type recombinase/integrase [Holophagaceae bacterium]|nr:tyrosine-type recombinase/integrase [Holophagaceae bacterium]
MPVAEPIKNKSQLTKMAKFWLKHGNVRNYTMIILGVYSALRMVDLLRLKWKDVYDFDLQEFRRHIVLTEKKTGKQTIIAINCKAIVALKMCFQEKRGEFIFGNNRKEPKALSRVQAWRIIKIAAKGVKLDGQISCHSLRKTFGYFAWKAGVLPVMLMDIFNHSSFEITKRYLGITQEDRDKVYLGMVLC